MSPATTDASTPIILPVNIGDVIIPTIIPVHVFVPQCAAASPLQCSTGAGLSMESQTTAGACLWVAGAWRIVTATLRSATLWLAAPQQYARKMAHGRLA
jgi:hypothetical protein